MIPDYSKLDAGIVKTVKWLRGHGFDTTDSGDGVSKRGTDAEACAMDIPNVAMIVPVTLIVYEADRLASLCSQMLMGRAQPDWSIQATYSPLDGVAVILLLGIDDIALGDK